MDGIVKQRTDKIIALGIVFFLVGGFIVYAVLNIIESPETDHYPCVDRGGVPVEHYSNGAVVCIDPEALR